MISKVEKVPLLCERSHDRVVSGRYPSITGIDDNISDEAN